MIKYYIFLLICLAFLASHKNTDFTQIDKKEIQK
jgi:hypothetical protein